MGSHSKERAAERITRLAGKGLDLASFSREASEAVASVVPHYRTPCWFTFDPASLLVTSQYEEGLPEIPHEWLAHGYFERDVHKMARCRSFRARDLDAARGHGRRPEP